MMEHLDVLAFILLSRVVKFVMKLLLLKLFIFILSFISTCNGFSTTRQNNILILDHFNINHQKGRHDWLKAFYVDFLQCTLDPRKMENVKSGKKTIWANIGANQFHLPEGKPDAQVLDGVITLFYPDLSKLLDRYESVKTKLDGSLFEIQSQNNGVLTIDPWGSTFFLVEGDLKERDSRGQQPGETSEGMAMRDLTIHTPTDTNLSGIGRFYEYILGGVINKMDDESIQIQVGPLQSLTFKKNLPTTVESHVDLRNEQIQAPEEGRQEFLSNYGPHISMYVRDLKYAYERADSLGLAYVNPRFKRRAYTLEEALDDCMFRCLDIIDPENIEDGPILKLEHEVRSVVRTDGSMYKSCPFDEIPYQQVS